MGGLGSGFRGIRRKTVEECLTIDSDRLLWWLRRFGGWAVRGSIDGETAFGIRIDPGPEEAETSVIASGHIERGGKRRNWSQVIAVELAPANLGSVRRYWRCPVCGLRAKKLHLPYGRSEFACRKCWNLTYERCQMGRPRMFLTYLHCTAAYLADATAREDRARRAADSAAFRASRRRERAESGKSRA